MNNLKNKNLKIKAANVEINTKALNTISGSNIPESIFLDKIEGSSLDESVKYIKFDKELVKTNHFLLMLQVAFDQHKPVSIAPDDFWLLICQGFAEHIKLNSEKFKGILKLDETQKLQIQRDDFVLGQKNPWEEIFPDFTKKITQTINEDIHTSIVLNFTTSTKKEINAFEITFMDSMSSYFDYEFISMCGIPEIEIKGTIEDYQKIISSLEKLKKFNLDWWIDSIIPKIRNIIRALQGKNDIEFWSSMYKENNESGGPYVTGWIADFFPYLKVCLNEKDGVINYEQRSIAKNQILKKIEVEDLNFDTYKIHKVLIKNPRLMQPDYYKLQLDDFPSGRSVVPFKWTYLDKEIEMNFISGFIGVRECELNNTLKTDINWIVNRN